MDWQWRQQSYVCIPWDARACIQKCKCERQKQTLNYLNLPVTYLLFILEFWIILIFLTPLTWARGLGIFQLLCHRHCVKLRNHSFRWTNNTPWNPMKSYISFRWKWVLFVYNFPLLSLDGSFARYVGLRLSRGVLEGSKYDASLQIVP